MSLLRIIVLIRHGETEGESSVRFHGSSDVPLAEHGRAQMRATAARLPLDHYDVVVSSPLRRAWESASIVARGAPVRIETAFREIDFGRWEGLTAEEIRARDPILYEDWRSRAPGFEFPGGERRADFRARVAEGIARLQASGARTAIAVAHKGVMRAIAEWLTGLPLEGDLPLGEAVQVTRGADDRWFVGRRASSPLAACRIHLAP
jgi:broad specificity phosphatase PhoE